jgi:hypothetical protein
VKFNNFNISTSVFTFEVVVANSHQLPNEIPLSHQATNNWFVCVLYVNVIEYSGSDCLIYKCCYIKCSSPLHPESSKLDVLELPELLELPEPVDPRRPRHFCRLSWAPDLDFEFETFDFEHFGIVELRFLWRNVSWTYPSNNSWISVDSLVAHSWYGF